ncbi:hypothetical protein [Rathayibacter festucae]|uniref:hypothetical protein n=1 Tax=Rathayibacter festucae TaxID=110937 RepID=UPI002A69A5FF|nr:hypothetical protein [Rathayibacter festucae]MDY0911313.1 hypothetical protein [Rathayibacter festucae]
MGVDKEIDGREYRDLKRSHRRQLGPAWDAEKRALANLTKSKIDQALKVTRFDLKGPTFEHLLTFTVSQLRRKLDAAIVVLDEHAEAEVKRMTHRQLTNEVARLRKRKVLNEKKNLVRTEHLRSSLREYGQNVGSRSAKVRVERGDPRYEAAKGLTASTTPDPWYLIEGGAA